MGDRVILTRLAQATAVVPSIWPLEGANVLLVVERQKRLSESDSMRFLVLLSQLPLRVERAQTEKMIAQLLTLAGTGNLSSYDASYLDLAMRGGFPLATLDGRLIEAARRIDVAIIAIRPGE